MNYAAYTKKKTKGKTKQSPKGLIEEGWSITHDELTMPSPYMTHHVKRFGNYVMDLETLPDLPLPV